ncbi:hypothetical protein T492DRAFT_46517 [Pavlovales sp. CCMP2436]|nr:hypothetical protein T492DRAFT_46517 [Pavlovales sp. CCMP2436]
MTSTSQPTSVRWSLHSQMHAKERGFSRAQCRARTPSTIPTTSPIGSRRSSSSAVTLTGARSSRCAASAAGRPKGSKCARAAKWLGFAAARACGCRGGRTRSTAHAGRTSRGNEHAEAVRIVTGSRRVRQLNDIIFVSDGPTAEWMQLEVPAGTAGSLAKVTSL